jgi:hypothetical protein
MTIQYIKSLIDDKIIYKFTNNTNNLTDKTSIYNPYNGITDTDDDYFNHLNNILKSGLYIIKPIATKSYVLLINKYIFRIDKNQLIILKKLINLYRQINLNLPILSKSTNLINQDDLNNICKIIMSDVLTLKKLNDTLKLSDNIELNCNRSCLLFVLFIIDSLIEVYSMVSSHNQDLIKNIFLNIAALDFNNCRHYLFILFEHFQINKDSIKKLTDEMIFAINKINVLNNLT